jgi:hypothetical protein
VRDLLANEPGKNRETPRASLFTNAHLLALPSNLEISMYSNQLQKAITLRPFTRVLTDYRVSGKINIALSVKESAAKGEVHRRESRTLNKCDIELYYYSREVN